MITTTPRSDLPPEALMWLLNQYRAAEVHGAGAIMRMGKLADSSELRASLSRHLRDEAVHAWLWTRTLTELGGEVAAVPEPYQAKLAAYYGIPTSLNDLLVLTLVSEKRGLAQYVEHLDVPGIPPEIHRTLRGILKDEEWHVRYIAEELDGRSRRDRGLLGLIERAEDADQRAVAYLQDAAGPTGW